MPVTTYLDSCVLIASLTGKGDTARKAYDLLNDAGRVFSYSDFVRLETICKPTFYRLEKERAFYARFFATATKINSDDALVQHAVQLGSTHDISPFDALHLAASVSGKVAEFITAEKPTSPIFRAGGLGVKITSIYTPP